MSGVSVIAATFCCDSRDISQYRYQTTRTRQAVYAIGDNYYAVGKRAPSESVGGEWKKHRDQFFAKQKNTVLWVSSATEVA